MAIGIVKWYMLKQYGMIQTDDKSAVEVFVHERIFLQSEVPTLEEGDKVEYKAELDTKGKRAATFVKKVL